MSKWLIPVAPTRLACVRILTGLFALWWLCARYERIIGSANSSIETWQPVGVTLFLKGPLDPQWVSLCLTVTILLLCLFTLGVAFRVIGPLCSVAALFVFTYANSWSMIYHYENMLVLHVIIVGLTSSASLWSVDAWLRQRFSRPDESRLRYFMLATHSDGMAHWRVGFVIRLLQLATTLPYLVAGVAKIYGTSGWSWAHGGNLLDQVTMNGIYYEMLKGGASEFTNQVYQWDFFFAPLAIGTLVLELGAPLASLHRRIGYCWVAAVIIMHWSIVWIMGIYFPYQLYGVAFASFIEWERLAHLGHRFIKKSHGHKMFVDWAIVKIKKLKGLCVIIPALVTGGWFVVKYVSAPRDSFESPTVASTPMKTDDSHTVLLADSLSKHGSALQSLWVKDDEKGLGSLLSTSTEGVYVAARQEGKRVAYAWANGSDVASTLPLAFRDLKGQLGESGLIDTLECFVSTAVHPVTQKNQKRFYANVMRGTFGISIEQAGEKWRYSPTEVVATNRSTKRILEVHHRQFGPKTEETFYSALEGVSFLVDLTKGSIRLLERGNELVPLFDVNRDTVEHLSQGLGDWLFNNLDEDGRMTYLYWPSKGAEADDRDNTIRQWMASVAMVREAIRRKDGRLIERTKNNIDHNLRRYYRQDGELGVIALDGKAKLGAIALAALAISEHPLRERWSVQETALNRTTEFLWNANGSFRTFYEPENRDDNHNFYPGEALLYWANQILKEEEGTTKSARTERFMKSFEYYKVWHLDEERRNPAFIPWHTQANFKLFQKTKNPLLAKFVFEMNDWLVPIQEWDMARRRDAKGRFYDSSRPFGPPHASATGVYLEGLIDAYSLARQLNDDERAKVYQLSIRRGLRSAMQLQFVDNIDMFYVSDRKRVRGGIRTTVYDNQIRCDNVQHILMAVQKILQTDVLEWKAY